MEPVLDLKHTFLDPELPWGKENFSPAHQELLHSRGFLMIDNEFEAGRVLFEEFQHYKPLATLVASSVRALVLHGDRDRAVSYEIARQAARARSNTEFDTIIGSDHGFDTRKREDEAVSITVGWLIGDEGTQM